MTAAAFDLDLYCSQCGYNLRGCAAERCPECGYDLAGFRTAEPQIPWARRRGIGWVRAYVKTLWMTRMRHRVFCEEMARPVSYRDAQTFRWTTILLAYLPVLAGTVLAYLLNPPRLWSTPLSTEDFLSGFGRGTPTALELAYADVWRAVVLHVCFLLFLAAATGVPSYFFHPKALPIEQQNRAIALSYYLCGPLVLTACAVAWIAAWTIPEEAHGHAGAVLRIAGYRGGILFLSASERQPLRPPEARRSGQGLDCHGGCGHCGTSRPCVRE